MTAPELSTIWPDNLAAWLNATEATMQMATTRKILEICMSVRTVGAAILTASFANVTAEFVVAFDLIWIQHGAYLSLGVFLDGLDARPCLGPQLSNLIAALFKDLIHAIALRLIETEIIMNPAHISLQIGGPAAVVVHIRRAA